MLVLSRNKEQTIVVGDDVRITIVDVKGDKVRLGIEAPRSVAVHREEVWVALNQPAPRAAAA